MRFLDHTEGGFSLECKHLNDAEQEVAARIVKALATVLEATGCGDAEVHSVVDAGAGPGMGLLSFTTGDGVKFELALLKGS